MEKLWKRLKYVLFVAVQCTWGLPQTLIGAVIFLVYAKCRHECRMGTVATESEKIRGGVSLGLFIFTGKDDLERLFCHEYGHSVQSLILGPLYLPLIGLESFIHSRHFKGDYNCFYTEKWANAIASWVFKKEIHL
ncbi:MAG: hypothetical protein Q4B67_03470 [Eubacteriales bacterium]|nr:hypothetical protein [Eubacteriales bacterium]